MNLLFLILNHAVLILFCFVARSSAQYFTATDTTGEFNLLFHSGLDCPKSIVHHEVLSTSKDDYFRIPHEKISQEGVDCSPGGNFLIMNDDHYESSIRTVVRQVDGTSILSALYGMQSPVLIGVERDARVCGASGFPKETSFLFFRYDGATTITGLPSIEEGTVIMVSFESNPDLPCIYATSDALSLFPLADEDTDLTSQDSATISSTEVEFDEEPETITTTTTDTITSTNSGSSTSTVAESSSSSSVSSNTAGSEIKDISNDENIEVPEEKPSPVSADPLPENRIDPNPSTIPPIPVTDNSEEHAQTTGKRTGRKPENTQATVSNVPGLTIQAEPAAPNSTSSTSKTTVENNNDSKHVTNGGNDFNSVSPVMPQNEGPTPKPGEEDDNSFLTPEESYELISDSLQSRQCFPGDSKALLRDGSLLRLDKLRVGQFVSVGVSGKYFSQVIAFSHADKSKTPRKFIKLTTASGKSIRATPGHLIYVKEQNKLVTMRSVRIGDSISQGNEEVVSIDLIVSNTGLFNPQTASGNILVDEIVMSSYTEAVQPIVAHSLLTPVRTAWKVKTSLSKHRNQQKNYYLHLLKNVKKTYDLTILIAMRLYAVSVTTGT